MPTPFFITEKETEELLTFETRPLRLPDGSTHQMTASKLHWASFDFIVERGWFTPERLAELAVVNTAETQVPLDRSFRHIVTFIRQEYKIIEDRD